MMAHHQQQQPYDPYYPHQPQSQPQPEPGYATVFNDRNAISTVFVSGLPDDVKAREIHNLFRRRPGFDYCQLKYTGRGNQVVAFATFVNHQSAMAALHSLNGAKFDPQTGSTLHIELARTNSRRKRKPGSGAYVVIDKRSRAATDAQATSSDDGDSESDEPIEQNNPDSGNNDTSGIAKRWLKLQSSNEAKLLFNVAIFVHIAIASEWIISGEGAVDDAGNTAAENEQSEKAVNGAQPCSTLFIANLGPNCTEDELKEALSQYPGFNSLKMRDRGGMPVAFADFEEIEQATEAMNTLQESTLPSSDRGGMHIEYARSKMRKP
ncbi:hypothetical protein LguiB_008413 [Lonicera macranthoides]